MSKQYRRKKRLGCLPKLLIAGVVIAGLVVWAFSIPAVRQSYEFITGKISKTVLDHRTDVSAYAEEYGISEYVPYLLSIMEVESSGQGEDVMQSSESLGLEPNSLSTQESIEQGVAYFAKLVHLAEQEGCDIDTAVQAYNYGPGFIDYVAENGGVYSEALAQAYARENSDGRKVKYHNAVALKENGGWRYDYGNMFYVRLVNRFLEDASAY